MTPARRLATLLRAAPAVLVAVPALVFVGRATERASWASLGRDQGIFQYVAWAVAQGDVAYRDVRDVNGPVITMVHLFFQCLGGADEHRFRSLDLLLSGVTFALAGASVPSLSSSGPVTFPVRAAWALAGWVLLSAQYLVFGFWDTAQRESFLDWFVLASLASAFTRTANGDPRSRATRAVLVLSGALSFVPWLGKPTYALFTAAQLLAIAIGEEPFRTRRARGLLFGAGGLLGLAFPLGFLLLRGDLGAWARITFVDVPVMYRFIWPRSPVAILSLPGYAASAWVAASTTTGLLVLVARRRLPRRALPIAMMPMLGLVSVVVQAKGFPYHFHPVTVGVSFGWLVALGALSGSAPASSPSRIRSAVVLGASILIGLRASHLARAAPYPEAPSERSRDRASLESAERLAAFERIDFFPRALRDAAEYLDAHTAPHERVQTYGMDAYVLFLARRRSATPYVYAYDLNADAALHGSFDPDGLHPTREEADRIRALRDMHARDLLERLERAPPAAFVFVDRSPLMSYLDSVVDFSTHCPEAAAWLGEHYRQTADFDGIRVWLPVTAR